MFVRCFFLLVLVSFSSCDKFSFQKKTKIALDTIVNFSSVDTSPSFKICDSIIDKEQQSDCFRNTIHKKIGEELQQHQFTITDSISETIYVAIVIDARGKITLKNIESSEYIKKQLPSLDSVLQVSIDKIPTVYPAIKRGIPVTTKYRLPIKIQLQE